MSLIVDFPQRQAQAPENDTSEQPEYQHQEQYEEQYHQQEDHQQEHQEQEQHQQHEHQDQYTKRVSFAPTNDLKFIANLSHSHKSSLWFSEREIKSFKYQTAWIIKTIKSNNMTVAQYAEMNAQETGAFMGLENYLSDTTTNEIRYQRRLIARAVLAEQDRQVTENGGINDVMWDAEQMSSVSKSVSGWATKRSQIIALIHVDKR